MRLRAAASAMTLLGTLVSVSSLLGTSWYAITGPNVISDPAQMTPNNGAVALIVDPHVGSRHSWMVWAIFGCCVVAAIVAGLPTARLSSAGRIVAPVLAFLLILMAVARVAITRFAFGTIADAPPGTTVDVHLGFWVALVGFVLIGTGAALGPRWSSMR